MEPNNKYFSDNKYFWLSLVSSETFCWCMIIGAWVINSHFFCDISSIVRLFAQFLQCKSCSTMMWKLLQNISETKNFASPTEI